MAALQVVKQGAFWSLGLGSVNLALQHYVKSHPGSALGIRVIGGTFNQKTHQYFVSLAGQVSFIPLCWAVTYFQRDQQYWFGSETQEAFIALFGYFFGYFVQDAILHFADNSGLVLLHHVAAAAGSALACTSSCWLGINATIAFTFELGSAAVILSDLGYGLKSVSNSLLIGTSVVPLIWVAHGLFTSPPVDCASFFCVVGAIIGGTLRVKEGINGLKEVSASAQKSSWE